MGLPYRPMCMSTLKVSAGGSRKTTSNKALRNNILTRLGLLPSFWFTVTFKNLARTSKVLAFHVKKWGVRGEAEE